MHNKAPMKIGYILENTPPHIKLHGTFDVAMDSVTFTSESARIRKCFQPLVNHIGISINSSLTAKIFIRLSSVWQLIKIKSTLFLKDITKFLVKQP